MAISTTFFSSPLLVLTSAIALRVILFVYGFLQDAYSPMKYTDIDYYVFTDASRFLLQEPHTPYARETYRYTPLLAWMLIPTTFNPQWLWFSFGKLLFAISDIVAGWLIYIVLKREKAMTRESALKFASIWLLNPMVATISTRGSSEGLLGVMVVVLLWAVLGRKVATAGVVLGLGVHFKIYPFIYAPSIIWWMDDVNLGLSHPASLKKEQDKSLVEIITRFCNRPRIILTITSLLTFVTLNTLMYLL
jgi:phosphatidylinositol glycan class M